LTALGRLGEDVRSGGFSTPDHINMHANGSGQFRVPQADRDDVDGTPESSNRDA
jgi:hypothetical protein